MDENDMMVTLLTDSMELYQSRLRDMRAEVGEYAGKDAVADFARDLQGASAHRLLELRLTDRRRIHNLKSFTWVEQQGKTCAELGRMWSEREYRTGIQKQTDELDELIAEFNALTRA